MSRPCWCSRAKRFRPSIVPDTPRLRVWPRGAYVLADAPDADPEVILIGTGSEVLLCLDAYEELNSEGVRARVVSMPSWELFDHQDSAYRESILPPRVKARVSAEQASGFGWTKYTGIDGENIGIVASLHTPPLLPRLSPASSLLRGVPPLGAAFVLSPSWFMPLAASPLASAPKVPMFRIIASPEIKPPICRIPSCP